MANDTPLMDTGLDSLSAVQFRNDLTRDFNVKLPASLMFDYPTITALTEKIVQSLEASSAFKALQSAARTNETRMRRSTSSEKLCARANC